MNISKSDAIAHLAKWYNAGAEVRVVYHSVTGNLRIIGRIEELSSSAIKVVTIGSEMLLYSWVTSEYEYNDVRQLPTHVNKYRTNKYSITIEETLSNIDR